MNIQQKLHIYITSYKYFQVLLSFNSKFERASGSQTKIIRCVHELWFFLPRCTSSEFAFTLTRGWSKCSRMNQLKADILTFNVPHSVSFVICNYAVRVTVSTLYPKIKNSTLSLPFPEFNASIQLLFPTLCNVISSKQSIKGCMQMTHSIF